MSPTDTGSDTELLKDLLLRVTRLERIIAGGDTPQDNSEKGRDFRARTASLYSMTTRQHVAMQMVLGGFTNVQIAEQMNVSESTAKAHVKQAAEKIGGGAGVTRIKIASALSEVLQHIDPLDYERASGGLPLDWCSKYRGENPDPYKHLYISTRSD